jgi:hypothetical protein
MRVNVGETTGLYSSGSDVRFRFGDLKRRPGVSIAKCYAAAVSGSMNPQRYIFQTQFLIFATRSSLTTSQIQARQKDEIKVLSLCVKWSKFLGLDGCKRNLQHNFDSGGVSFGRAPSIKSVSLTEACCQSSTRSPINSIVQKCARPQKVDVLNPPANMFTSIRHA